MIEALDVVSSQLNQSLICSSDYRRCRALLFRHSGLILSDKDLARVSHLLSEELSQCQLESFSEYFDELESPSNEQMVQRFVQLMSNPQGGFFKAHLQLEKVLPMLATESNPDQELRAWITSSNGGEDAYSLAMALGNHFSDREWRVIGTDESHRQVFRAKSGVFQLAQKNQIPEKFQDQYCLPYESEASSKFRLSDELRAQVEFKQFDLKSDWLRVCKFDLIYLHQSLPFFNYRERSNLLKKLHVQLKPNGLLVLGRAEALSLDSSQFAYVAPSIYQRVD